MRAGARFSRREFFSEASRFGLAAGGLAMLSACGGSAASSQARKYRVGYYSGGGSSDTPGQIREALRGLGYDDNRLAFEVKLARGDVTSLKGLGLDVIVAGGAPSVRAVAFLDIPIVGLMPLVSDPVAEGFADSLSHPGRNITGLVAISLNVWGKRLELLKATSPQASRVGVLTYSRQAFESDPGGIGGLWRGLPEAAALGLELIPCIMVGDDQAAHAFETATANHVDAIVVEFSNALGATPGVVAGMALQNHLLSVSGPAGFGNDAYVRNGGLMSLYGDTSDWPQRAAVMVDRILKGDKPGDIPMERPTKFALALNLTTATALGVTFPESVLLQATDVVR